MIGLTISAEVGWPDSAIAQKVACALARKPSDVRPRHSTVSDARPAPGACGAASVTAAPAYLHPDMPCDRMAAVALSARTTGNVSQPLTQAALTEKSAVPTLKGG